MKKPKEYWSLGKHVPFKNSFDKLEPQDKWIVAHAIEQLVFVKNPEQRYPRVECVECGVDESYHLSAVANDGVGNMGVELLFKVNSKRKLISPIYTRRTRLYTHKQLLNR